MDRGDGRGCRFRPAEQEILASHHRARPRFMARISSSQNQTITLYVCFLRRRKHERVSEANPDDLDAQRDS